MFILVSSPPERTPAKSQKIEKKCRAQLAVPSPNSFVEAAARPPIVAKSTKSRIGNPVIEKYAKLMSSKKTQN